MEKSENIEIELNEVNSRLNELLEMRQSLEHNLKSLQSGFITKRTNTTNTQPHIR